MMTAAATQMRYRLETEMPPYRPVAVQLLRLAGEHAVSLPRIVNLLRTDPVLTLGLLRIANSALFSGGREITDVVHAVAFLGLDLVRSLAAAAATRALIDERHGRLMLACWRHSLATALTCKRLSGFAGLEPERCYTAGLIHDVGQLAMLRVLPEYEQVIVGALERGEKLTDAERTAFGIHHGEAGQWLLSRWQCPLELQNVAAFHENPLSGPSFDRNLIRLVQAGSQLTELMQMAVFPSHQAVSLEEIAGIFPEGRRQAFLDSLPDMAEWVMINVNGTEMSFV
jgi:HD-like signal output (HDOD) protein